MYRGSIEEEFDRLPLLSRQSDGSNMDALSMRAKDIQRRFYDHILEQFERLQKVDPTERTDYHFDPVLAKLRKLREGITSTGVYDEFAANVYETSVDVCLLAKNFAELLKSLVQILGTVYPRIIGDKQRVPDLIWCTKCQRDRPISSFAGSEQERASAAMEYGRQRRVRGPTSDSEPEAVTISRFQTFCSDCSSGERKEDLLSRRAELTGYMLLYLICYTARGPKCYGDANKVMEYYRELPTDLQRDQNVTFALSVFKALHADIDYVSLAHLWHEASTNQQTLLQTVWPLARQRIYDVLSRAYYTYPEKQLRLSLRLEVQDQFTDFMRKQIGSDSVASRINNGTVQLRVPKRVKQR
ncbi:uncharacterized protein SPPG_00028 [Spizellomyces punctatus DAOM BR117]|uniref:SAC3/GANP/THP3 conserved domain-containing protein n=1 Tax=Spizellomyces punctatus (strain DAOM BR117) TaxID=645134 RepID=A0A0L0HTR8_SPIPD|nr:uncharacterized protein SPPG_00028 [Spizellomyces punctatus DAOM BR117]KND04295.1 hypothetical protein SPPG_00028 [Spizellomyces punctatus DAOM BR117]|eukprot:XP_016612334.1 hypothetical protein SPPG_00028 [Spizellomyces punctatus DAOM BR117]